MDCLEGCIARSSPRIEREDFLYVDNVPYQNLIEGCEILFSKAGYSILSEAIRSGTKQIWLHRSNFPETPYLESYAQNRNDIILYERIGSTTFSNELAQAIQTLRNQSQVRPKVNQVSLASRLVFGL